MTTIDDVLNVASPLRPGQVALLLGYRAGTDQIGSLRATGRQIADQRLRGMATQLRAIADAVDALEAVELPPPVKAAEPIDWGKPEVKPRVTKNMVIEMLLRRADGATIAEIVDATGWQARSATSAISILRKQGLNVRGAKEGRELVYKVLPS